MKGGDTFVEFTHELAHVDGVRGVAELGRRTLEDSHEVALVHDGLRLGRGPWRK
jgi:hypothetical protein